MSTKLYDPVTGTEQEIALRAAGGRAELTLPKLHIYSIAAITLG